MSNTHVYIGSWCHDDWEHTVGITSAIYDWETGKLQSVEHTFPELNCGAVCLDETRGILYCVDERTEIPDETLGGQIYALKINPVNGKLTELNHSPSYGGMTSYCALSEDRSYLVVTNHSSRDSILKTIQDENGHYQIIREYNEASVVLFRLNEDGSIGEPCDIVRHKGRGLLPNQQSPHPHSVIKAPLSEIFVVCDKGNDSVYSYRIDRENDRLVQCDKIAGISGSSPRYSVFHPTLPYFYYNNETKPVIGVVQYDQDGRLSPVCYINCTGGSCGTIKGMQADIRIDANGRYMYNLVRDIRSISVYEINETTGIPLLVQSVPFEGQGGGKGLAISPDGRYLYLAAYPDAEVKIFEIDTNGRLKEIGAYEDVAPGTITFYESREYIA